MPLVVGSGDLSASEIQAEVDWLTEENSKALQKIADTLRDCASRLDGEVVKLPLAVPSRTEVRGILGRTGARAVLTANVALPGLSTFSVHGVTITVPQLSVLSAGLKQAESAALQAYIYPERILVLVETVLEAVDDVTAVGGVQESLFPSRVWAPSGMPPGVCADLRLQFNKLILNVYTWQDRAGKPDHATTITTAEATDPILGEVLMKVVAVRNQLQRICRNNYNLNISGGMSHS